MPLTAKGREIFASMKHTYKTDKKAKQVFYASANAGKIQGVHPGHTVHGAHKVNLPLHG